MKRILEIILSYIPTALPVGMTEFVKWQDSVLSMSKVPDNDSTRFTLAVMIVHLDPTSDVKAKRYFIKALNKAAANEIANAVATGLRDKKLAETKAAQEAKIAASTASTSNGVAQNS